MDTGVRLRAATASDAAILHRRDTEPHVLASDPHDDWHWDVELTRSPPWREQLIAKLKGEPVGFVEIIDPRERKTLLETGRPLPEFAPVADHLRPAQESSA